MLKRLVLGLSCVALMLHLSVSHARYSQKLCKTKGYKCHKVKGGQTWHRLFPDAEARDIVMRVNRMNTGLRAGLVIAIPKNLHDLTVYDVAPFPRYIDPAGEKTIYVSQKDLAWGAYDEQGELLWWGPVSPGKNYCGDVGRGCKTPAGEFRIIRKQGIDCISSKFPIETDGGAPMPFCMHFFGGYALHGSYTVPGYRASHGCVRMFIEDARWLNREFIDVPGQGRKGTRVIVGGV